MRIISTVMLSKQARTNCSLRNIIPCKRGKYSGQKDRGVPGQESHKPRTNSCSRVVTPEHPPTFNYELALEQWLPKSGTDTFFFPPNDLKNSYSRLMTVQNLQFSFTPQKLQPGNRCFRYCLVFCNIASYPHAVPARALARAGAVRAASQGVFQRHWGRRSRSRACQQIKWYLESFPL